MGRQWPPAPGPPGASPNAASASPQHEADTAIASPCRRIPFIHPLVAVRDDGHQPHAATVPAQSPQLTLVFRPCPGRERPHRPLAAGAAPPPLPTPMYPRCTPAVGLLLQVCGTRRC